PVDQDGAAAGGGAGVDVAPAVSYEETGFQIDSVAPGRLQQQAWFGFAAGAGIGVIVPAREEIVERERGGDGAVHGFGKGARLGAARYVGLIGDHDQQKTGG